MDQVELGLSLNTARADAAIAASAKRAQDLFERRGIKLNIKSPDLPLGRITGDMNKFSDSLDAAASRVLAFTATTSVVYGLARAFGGLFTESVKLEKQLATIQSVLQTSTTNLNSLKNELFSIANATGQAFDVAASAAEEFARQGLTVEETAKATAAALTFSKIAGIDAATSVQTLTAALNTFNDGALNYTDIVDTITTLDASFAISAAGIADGLKRIGSVASEAGVDLKEIASLISVVQQVSARGAPVISNGLKTIFTRLNRTSVQEALQGIGVQTQDANGGFRSQIEVLTDLANVFDTLSDSQRAYISEQVAGVYQINTLQATLKTLRGEYSLYEKAVNIASDSSGSAAERLKILTQTTDANLQSLKNNVSQFLAEAGKVTVKPILDNFVGLGNSILQTLNKNLFSDDAEGIGATIGKSLIKGIASILSGPGTIFALFALSKLLLNIGRDALKALAVLGNLKTTSVTDSNAQKAVNAAIANGNALLIQRLQTTTDIVARTQILNKLLADQANRQAATQINSLINTGLGKTPRKGKASGFIPNFSEAAAPAIAAPSITKSTVSAAESFFEAQGALDHGYKPGKVYSTRIHDGNGKSEMSVVNSAEKVVNFVNDRGKKATMVIPPNGFGRDTQYAARGFVPNLFNKDEEMPGVKIKKFNKDEPLRDSIGNRLKRWARLDTDSTTRRLTFKDPDTGETILFSDVIDDFSSSKGLSDKSANEYINWLNRAAQSNPPIREVVSDIQFAAIRPSEQTKPVQLFNSSKKSKSNIGYSEIPALENSLLKRKFASQGFVPNFNKGFFRDVVGNKKAGKNNARNIDRKTYDFLIAKYGREEVETNLAKISKTPAFDFSSDEDKKYKEAVDRNDTDLLKEMFAKKSKESGFNRKGVRLGYYNKGVPLPPVVRDRNFGPGYYVAEDASLSVGGSDVAVSSAPNQASLDKFGLKARDVQFRKDEVYVKANNPISGPLPEEYMPYLNARVEYEASINDAFSRRASKYGYLESSEIAKLRNDPKNVGELYSTLRGDSQEHEKYLIGRSILMKEGKIPFDSVRGIGGRTLQDKNMSSELVVQNASQIKSAALAEYDDDGNLIPLSKRFDEGDDIRGSKNPKKKRGRGYTIQSPNLRGKKTFFPKGFVPNFAKVKQKDGFSKRKGFPKSGQKTAGQLKTTISPLESGNTQTIQYDGLIKGEQSSKIADAGKDFVNNLQYKVQFLDTGNYVADIKKKLLDPKTRESFLKILEEGKHLSGYSAEKLKLLKENIKGSATEVYPVSYSGQPSKNKKIKKGSPLLSSEKSSSSKKQKKEKGENKVSLVAQIGGVASYVGGKVFEKKAIAIANKNRSNSDQLTLSTDQNARMDLLNGKTSVGEIKVGAVRRDNLLSKAIAVHASNSTKNKKFPFYFDKTNEKDPDQLNFKTPFILLRRYQTKYDQEKPISDDEYKSSGFIPNFAPAIRRIGILDADILDNPQYADIVRAQMANLQVSRIYEYYEELGKLAIEKRDSGGLKKVKAIYGTAGSGKTSLAFNLDKFGNPRQSDDSRLRKIIRIPIIQPSDIDKVDEIIATKASITTTETSLRKPSGFLGNVNSYRSLNTPKEVVEKNRENRMAGAKEGPTIASQGRSPSDLKRVSREVPSEFDPYIPLVAKDVWQQKYNTWEENFKVDNPNVSPEEFKKAKKDRLSKFPPPRVIKQSLDKEGNLKRSVDRNPYDIVSRKIAFAYGAFAPFTKGHEKMFEQAKSLGFQPKDIVFGVSAGAEIDPDDDHSLRTTYFPADFRMEAIKRGTGASTAYIDKNFKGSVPSILKLSDGTFVKPAPGSIALTGDDKNLKETEKYKKIGLETVQGPRTKGVSGTELREAIKKGDIAKIKELSGSADFIIKNIDIIGNRINLLDEIKRRKKIKLNERLSPILNELETLPKRLTDKTSSDDREKVLALRKQRDRLKAAFAPEIQAVMKKAEGIVPGLKFDYNSLDIGQFLSNENPYAQQQFELSQASGNKNVESDDKISTIGFKQVEVKIPDKEGKRRDLTSSILKQPEASYRFKSKERVGAVKTPNDYTGVFERYAIQQANKTKSGPKFIPTRSVAFGKGNAAVDAFSIDSVKDKKISLLEAKAGDWTANEAGNKFGRFLPENLIALSPLLLPLFTEGVQNKYDRIQLTNYVAVPDLSSIPAKEKEKVRAGAIRERTGGKTGQFFTPETINPLSRVGNVGKPATRNVAEPVTIGGSSFAGKSDTELADLAKSGNAVAQNEILKRFASGKIRGPRRGLRSSGFIPNFSEAAAPAVAAPVVPVSSTVSPVESFFETQGALDHGYKPGKVYSTRIHDGNGKSEMSVVNSAERVVNFVNDKGKRATMVVPPNGFGRDTQYAAKGFVPNFNGINDLDIRDKRVMASGFVPNFATLSPFVNESSYIKPPAYALNQRKISEEARNYRNKKKTITKFALFLKALGVASSGIIADFVLGDSGVEADLIAKTIKSVPDLANYYLGNAGVLQFIKDAKIKGLTITDILEQKLIRAGTKGLIGLENKTKALVPALFNSTGFIPNFAITSLPSTADIQEQKQEAVKREVAAGYNRSDIRAGTSPSLVSPSNPRGLGIYNKYEGSLQEGIRLAENANIDPITKGMTKETVGGVFSAPGFIPNFANAKGRRKKRRALERKTKLSQISPSAELVKPLSPEIAAKRGNFGLKKKIDQQRKAEFFQENLGKQKPPAQGSMQYSQKSIAIEEQIKKAQVAGDEKKVAGLKEELKREQGRIKLAQAGAESAQKTIGIKDQIKQAQEKGDKQKAAALKTELKQEQDRVRKIVGKEGLLSGTDAKAFTEGRQAYLAANKQTEKTLSSTATQPQSSAVKASKGDARVLDKSASKSIGDTVGKAAGKAVSGTAGSILKSGSIGLNRLSAAPLAVGRSAGQKVQSFGSTIATKLTGKTSGVRSGERMYQLKEKLTERQAKGDTKGAEKIQAKIDKQTQRGLNPDGSKNTAFRQQQAQGMKDAKVKRGGGFGGGMGLYFASTGLSTLAASPLFGEEGKQSTTQKQLQSGTNALSSGLAASASLAMIPGIGLPLAAAAGIGVGGYQFAKSYDKNKRKERSGELIKDAEKSRSKFEEQYSNVDTALQSRQQYKDFISSGTGSAKAAAKAQAAYEKSVAGISDPRLRQIIQDPNAEEEDVQEAVSKQKEIDQKKVRSKENVANLTKVAEEGIAKRDTAGSGTFSIFSDVTKGLAGAAKGLIGDNIVGNVLSGGLMELSSMQNEFGESLKKPKQEIKKEDIPAYGAAVLEAIKIPENASEGLTKSLSRVASGTMSVSALLDTYGKELGLNEGQISELSGTYSQLSKAYDTQDLQKYIGNVSILNSELNKIPKVKLDLNDIFSQFNQKKIINQAQEDLVFSKKIEQKKSTARQGSQLKIEENILNDKIESGELNAKEGIRAKSNFQLKNVQVQQEQQSQALIVDSISDLNAQLKESGVELDTSKSAQFLEVQKKVASGEADTSTLEDFLLKNVTGEGNKDKLNEIIRNTNGKILEGLTDIELATETQTAEILASDKLALAQLKRNETKGIAQGALSGEAGKAKQFLSTIDYAGLNEKESKVKELEAKAAKTTSSKEKNKLLDEAAALNLEVQQTYEKIGMAEKTVYGETQVTTKAKMEELAGQTEKGGLAAQIESLIRGVNKVQGGTAPVFSKEMTSDITAAIKSGDNDRAKSLVSKIMVGRPDLNAEARGLAEQLLVVGGDKGLGGEKNLPEMQAVTPDKGMASLGRSALNRTNQMANTSIAASMFASNEERFKKVSNITDQLTKENKKNNVIQNRLETEGANLSDEERTNLTSQLKTGRKFEQELSAKKEQAEKAFNASNPNFQEIIKNATNPSSASTVPRLTSVAGKKATEDIARTYTEEQGIRSEASKVGAGVDTNLQERARLAGVVKKDIESGVLSADTIPMLQKFQKGDNSALQDEKLRMRLISASGGVESFDRVASFDVKKETEKKEKLEKQAEGKSQERGGLIEAVQEMVKGVNGLVEAQSRDSSGAATNEKGEQNVNIAMKVDGTALNDQQIKQIKEEWMKVLEAKLREMKSGQTNPPRSN